MTTEADRIAPAAGAPAVLFDHAAAEAVLATLRAAVVATSEHGIALDAAAEDASAGWEGAHRAEFEQARDVLHRHTAVAIEALQAARRAVLAAVDDANTRQHAANRAAAQAMIDGGPPP